MGSVAASGPPEGTRVFAAAGGSPAGDAPTFPDDGPPAVARPDRILITDEDPVPVRRPADLVRAVVGALGVVLVLVVGAIAEDTMWGARSDMHEAGQRLPGVVRQALYASTSLLLLAVPMALLVRRALLRRWRQIGAALAAALLGLGASYLLAAWIVHLAPDSLAASLSASPEATPTASYLAAFAAFVVVADVSRRPWWGALAWGSVTVSAVAAILAGALTPLQAVVMVVLGRTIGAAATYVVGTANVRPSGRAVANALRPLGLDIVSGRRGGDTGEARAYEYVTRSGDRLRAVVLDRDQQGAGLLYQTYRWLRLQSPATRRSFVTLRQATDHHALLAHSTLAAGVRTPALRCVVPVGPDASVLAFTDHTATTFESLGEALSDEQLRGAWEQVRVLHGAQIAHRALTLGRFAVDAAGDVWLLDVRTGDIAASDFVLRLDLAQFLAETALAVGPDRAVRAAVDTLGGARVAVALPFLQPVALTRSTRAAVRRHRDLLGSLRARVAELAPVTVAAPVRLERIRPRTLVTVAAAAIAGYLLLGQLVSVDLRSVVTAADWRWFLAAFVLSALTYIAAAMSISGWVVEPLRFGQTLLAQVAGSFVKLVAPPSVAGVALNARYLQRSGVPPALALASIGVSQAVGLVIHVGLLALFVLLTGTSTTPAFTVPGWAYVVAGVVLGLGVLLAVTPRGRALFRARLQPLVTETLPRLVEIVQRPRKLAEGLGGTVLLSAGFVLSLWAAVHAFGGRLDIATVAVVFLAGSALGSVAPTPGGLGAVEAALATGLTAAGLPSETAVSAVLLFRLVTFWLPVLPGWLAFNMLQRRELI